MEIVAEHPGPRAAFLLARPGASAIRPLSAVPSVKGLVFRPSKLAPTYVDDQDHQHLRPLLRQRGIC